MQLTLLTLFEGIKMGDTERHPLLDDRRFSPDKY
jgi:hypothetical protein